MRISEPPRPFGDFDRAYYAAGAAVLADPEQLAPLLRRGLSGFVNVPIVAYVFAPFAAVPLAAAQVVFAALGLAAVAMAWRGTVELLHPLAPQRSQILLLFAASGPLANSLEAGNTSQFALLALVVSWTFLRRGRPTPAGVVIGAASLLKLPLLVFLPYFLLKRFWGAAVAVGLAWSTAMLLSIGVIGWSTTILWLQEFVLGASARTAAAFNVQSVPAFLIRLRTDAAALRDWSYLPLTLHEHVIAVAVLLALVGLAWYGTAARRVRHSSDDEFMIVATLATIAGPLVWTHYYCWLLLPLAWLWTRPPAGLAADVLRWMATLLVSAPVMRLAYEHPAMMAAYLRVGTSAWLVGGLMCLALLLWDSTRQSRTAAVAHLQSSSSDPIVRRV